MIESQPLFNETEINQIKLAICSWRDVDIKYVHISYMGDVSIYCKYIGSVTKIHQIIPIHNHNSLEVQIEFVPKIESITVKTIIKNDI